jgi:hypothetical protein
MRAVSLASSFTAYKSICLSGSFTLSLSLLKKKKEIKKTMTKTITKENIFSISEVLFSVSVSSSFFFQPTIHLQFFEQIKTFFFININENYSFFFLNKNELTVQLYNITRRG